jgi:hypothetical protein
MFHNHSGLLNRKRKFSKIYHSNAFQGDTSLSGRGSDLDQTKVIQRDIVLLLKKIGVKTMLDLPCGDQNWISRVDLSEFNYIGVDIVPELISQNQDIFGSNLKTFIELDVTKHVPPASDLILCRDLFVHLSTRDIHRALKNFKKSGARYLLTTTFVGNHPYKNLPIFSQNVGWRVINFQTPPFNFPEPITLINEECTEGDGKFGDKSLGLWEISDLSI